MSKLLFATSSKNKVREASDILGIPLEIAELELPEIQSMDLETVVRKKVEAAFEILKKPVMVDDVGFKIDAWNGFPGPFIKYLLHSLGNKKLLQVLKDEKNKKIVAQCAIGYHDGQKVHVIIGEIKGKFTNEERGKDGWGFDFFVIPEGQTKTMAELGFEEKNKVSHRHAALAKFKEFLDSIKN